MEKCEFSETQFSFCFTFEYLKSLYPKKVLPLFPNTVEEGRQGGGYDVKIGENLFFQFKIPQYYYNNSGNTRGKNRCAVFGPDCHDCYKIDIASSQFGLLKTLKAKDAANRVYYSAPNFHLENELFEHYAAASTTSNSSHFPIENFPGDLNGFHKLVYSPNYNYGVLCSEPVQIAKADNINPSVSFPKENTGLSLLEHALKIKYELDHTFIPLNIQNEEIFIKRVYAELLLKENIFWFPVSIKGDIVFL